MKKLAALTVLLCTFHSLAFAQKKFNATRIDNHRQQSLASHFAEYSLYNLPASDIARFTATNRGGTSAFELELPGLTSWKLRLQEHDLLDPNYTLTVNSNSERVIYPKPDCMTYWGSVDGENNSAVSLTIDNNVIYGIIRSNGQEYFIEPMNYLLPGSSPNIFVVYETRFAQNDGTLSCGLKEMEQRAESFTGRVEAGTTCQRVQLSIASDESMFIRYGSAGAVQTHNIGVMNNVIWDYVNAQFNITLEWIGTWVSCAILPKY